MMRTIIRAGHRRDRTVSLCGEMAATHLLDHLLGMGVDELSMSPVMIPAIKQIIRGVTWAEARDVARGVLRNRRKDVAAISKMMKSQMSMRFHRPLTFALTMLPSADIVRTIKSFEPAAKTLIGTTEGTDQEIRFSVPDVATTRGTARPRDARLTRRSDSRADVATIRGLPAALAPTEPGPGLR